MKTPVSFVNRLLSIGSLALAALVWSAPGSALAADPPTTWSQLTPPGGPGNRALQFGVVDGASNRLITFGGMSGSGASGVPPLYNHVWVLTNQDGLGGTPAWSQLSPTGTAPSARALAAGGYDAANNRLIVFGGNVNVGNCGAEVNDTWVLTNANGLGGTPAWIQLSPTGTLPSGRNHHNAVYDAANNRLIVFGGRPACGGAKNDLWVLTNANGLGGTPAWTQLSPTGTPPSERASSAVTYDPETNRLTLFSGQGVTNDLWILTNANGLGGTPAWVLQSPTGTLPPARYGSQTVYDAALNRMVVFGGYTAGGVQNDLWSLSNANGVSGTPSWAQLSPAGTLPTARAHSSGGWQSGSNRLTFFGGLNSAADSIGDIRVLAESQTLQFSTAAFAAGESSGSATITVTRAKGSSGAISVQYATSNGTATAGSDYTAASGTLNWADGDIASKTFPVSLAPDATTEANETFMVTLTAPTGGAALGTPSGAEVTIIDGSTPAPKISVGDVSITEGNVGTALAGVTVALSAPSGSAVTVNYTTSDGTAAAGADYTTASGTLTFPAGTTTQTISVPVIGDSLVEPNETFNVTLSSPTNAAVATGGATGGAVWTQLSPTGAPPAARRGFAGAYDAASDTYMLFGGWGASSGNFSDVWVLTGAGVPAAPVAWSQLSPTGGGPVAGGGQNRPAGYNPSSNRLIVVGTSPLSGANGSEHWVLTNANGTGGTPQWIALPSRQLSTAGVPTVAYDSNSNRLIVFGGYDGGQPVSDVWVLTNADGLGGVPAWVQLSPTGPGPARNTASGAYDPGSNRLIIHGGHSAGGVYENNLWVLTNANGLGGTPQWIQLAVGSPISNRYAVGPMAYDPATKRAMVFGGFSGQDSTPLSDTWIIANADGTTGTPRFIAGGASPAPAGRSDNGLVYVAGSDRMLMLMGYPTPGVASDVWVLSNASGQNIGDGTGLGTIVNDDLPSSTSWSQLTPTGGPGARAMHFMAVDTANNRMMTFGGASGSFAAGTPPLYNDVWVLTNQDGLGGTPAWTQLSPTGTAPAARALAAGGYDAANNRLIFFGGNRNVGNCNFHSNDTWVLTNANGLGGTPAWTQLSPTGTPPSQRSQHSAVYDATNNRLIVFGGSGSCNEYAAWKNDVWVLSNANGLGGTPAWTQLSPTGTLPPLRSMPAVTYDPVSNRLTVVSGTQQVAATDVWVLTNANGLGGTPAWAQQSPTGTVPSPRSSTVALYDDALDRMLILTGDTAAGKTNEAWALGNATAVGGTPAWSQSSPAGTPPSGRGSGAGVWRGSSRRATLFGGIVGTDAVNTIWVFAEAQAVQNGNVAFSTAAYSVSESGPTATITVTRTGGSTGAVSVQYATSNGTATAGSDYTAASGTLNWADGDSASKTFTVTVANDLVPESNETITLTLSNPTGGATLASPAVATLTLLDTSQPSVSIGDVTVTEGNAGTLNANFTVSLSFSPASANVTMNYATSNGTATTADNDYAAASGSLTFLIGGATTQQVSVVINGDTTAESDETFLVSLSTLVGATFADSQAQGTILNDDFSASQQWQSLRSMSRGHTGHTATLLPNGRILVAGGDDATGASAEVFDPATGAWTPTGALISARAGHTATLLPNGKVLVAGGTSLSGTNLQSAELYDPATGQWTSTGTLAHARKAHTATLLNSGKVLVAGGVEGTASQRFAELYDPATGTWVLTGSLPTGRDRAYHTATLLPNGQVLIAGGAKVLGVTLTTLLQCDIFDPAGGTNGAFTAGAAPAGTLNAGRAESPTATLLTNGKVLLAGGLTSGAQQASAELYDPDLNTWTATGSMVTGRHQHSASLLPNGNVMLVGGRNGASRLASAEVYNVGTGTWQSGGVLTAGRYAHTASLLPSGKILVAGGSASTFLTSVEMYDPFTGTWAAQGTIGSDRRKHTATVLPNGEVLMAGGETTGVALTTAMRFSPASGVWTATGSLGSARTEHTATLLSDGRVLAAGGQASGAPRSSAELYSPVTGLWTPTAPMSTSRYQHTASVLPGGRVFVVGGQSDGSNATATSEVYDKDTAQWTATASMNRPRYAHTATLLTNGNLLVAGGHDDTASIGSSLIYELATGAWRTTGSMNVDRMNHTAILLPSGKVLVAGGVSDQNEVRLTAEVYDPATETWSLVGPLAAGHESHAMALLDDGSVLVAGGALGTGSTVTEVFDGLVGVWRTTGALNVARYGGSLTVLPSGRALFAGGNAAGTTEVFDLGHLDARRPVISSLSGTLTAGSSYTVTGSKFGGGSEASGGSSNASASNYPLLELRSLQDDQVHRLTPGPVANFAADPLSLNVPSLPAIDPGFYRVTVRRAGVPSVSAVVSALCTISITSHPSAQSAAIGASATFSVVAPGALTYQWYKNGLPIAGANAAAYTTPPVTVPDAGSLYSVRAIGRCGELLSSSALLNITDVNPPDLTLLSPTGGEFWVLSTFGEVARTELVTWSMSDNVRVCRVEVALLASTGGAPYAPVPLGGFLPASVGSGGVCASPGVTTQSSTYTVPIDPPSGTAGSLYKVQVRVIDQAGNVTVRETPTAFYMVKANTESFKTMIVTNLQRLQARFGSGAAYTDMLLRLNELASHPKVQGVILDVGQFDDLSNAVTGLYKAWDTDPTNPDRANQVLFGCPATTIPGCASVKTGIHQYVHDLLRQAYTGVEYIVVVGDDGIIPMARLTDRGTLFTESNYTSVGGSGPIASAIAANKFLSDDALAVRQETRPDQLASALFVPDLSLGRLVETPTEISKVIATFISQDGLLDLDAITGPNAHKVLVTGYDFLTDMAKQVRTRWKSALGVSTPDNSLVPVDASLVGGQWNLGSVGARASELRTHLSGNGGARYGISALGGHASHFEEGVPGTNPFDIAGLNVRDIYGPDLCASPGQSGLDLSGGVVYSVGCHGGLAVPGSCAAAAGLDARTLDLPQTMLSRGVVAYVANSGFAWGLKHGVGYGERLMELLTEEMTRGGAIATGDAVRRAKQRYFLETPRYDAYDEKTLMQWTFYGLPMYAVKSGASAPLNAAPAPFSGPPPTAEEKFRSVESGGVRIAAQQAPRIGAAVEPPQYLVSALIKFDFSAAGLYRKWNSAGDDISATPAGCPDPSGCYYTLNNLVERSTGSSDLPVQPYFIYDSRLSNTSQHGVLWKGGTYDQESGWVPIFAELQSNGGDGSNHGVLPREIMAEPVAPRLAPGGDTEDCRASDLELNSTVVGAGEAIRHPTTGLYSTERRYRTVDIELFYFNDTRNSEALVPAPNCDRTGPAIGAGPYHQVTGNTVNWAIPVTDGAGVWRVLVVYNDNTVDGQGRGRWVPLELTKSGATTTWTGSQAGFAPGASLTYVVQAVDLRGNVSWVEYNSVPAPLSTGVSLDALTLPQSGVEYGIPLPIAVDIAAVTSTISVSDASVSEGYLSGSTMTFTVSLSAASASPVSVNYATLNGTALAGTDYTTTTGTLTFAAGETVKLLTVPVLGDATSEPNETFTLDLTSPSGATILDGTGTGTILNDDGSTISVTNSAVLEGTTGTPKTLAFTVVLSATSTSTITVDYATSDGTAIAGSDYTSKTGTLTFVPGQASQVISVTVTLDATVEPDETMFLNLSNPTNATIFDGQGQGTVQSDDGLLVSIVDKTTDEGNAGFTPVNFNVTLSAPAPGTVTVNWATADGTATAPLDYTAASGTVTFNVGESTKTVAVQVVGETGEESYENFFINLSAPTGGAAIGDGQAQGTITNTDGSTDRSRLMFHNFVSNRLYRWHMKNGNTLDTFNWVTPFATDPGWTVGAVADFDQDGQLDYLWHNINTGQMLFWYIDGDNLKGFQFVPYTMGPPWRVATTFDADGNGTPDIVFYNSTSGVVKVKQHDNATVLGEYDITTLLPGAGTVRVVAAVDANNDGDDELARYDSATGQVSAWNVSGATVSNTITYVNTQVTSPAYTLVSTKTDFNDDGLADLLWHNPTPTGIFSVWFMNGTTRIGTGSFLPFTATDPVWKVVGSANVW